MDEAETTTRRQSKRPVVPPSTHNLRDLRDIPRACQSCRKFKLRCSGERPQCVVCTEKGVVCEYDDPLRQSTRAAAASSSTNPGASTSRKRPAPTSSYAQIKESRQRKRAAAAATSCDFCRNDLRRKCDGLRPSCQSCIKRGVTCVYSGPASASTPTSATSPAPLAHPIPFKGTAVTVSDNEADSDVAMQSRSGSPDIPLAEIAKEEAKPRYPQGNGLGHAGSTRNPDGTNCTRPVACYFCIQVELPCTGDFPTCVNCIRRNRVCTYPDPSSYAHQFPRQSALHSRQVKDSSRGMSSPGKGVLSSPGKPPARGSVDSPRGPLDARGVLNSPDPSRGVLDPPPSLRGILDPPGTSRGVLDAPAPPRGVLDTPPRGLDTIRGVLDTSSAPRSAIDPPRGVLDAPQPTLYTSRSLPGPLNQPRLTQSQMTPTPPSMSVSPDPSADTTIHVVSAANTNGVAKTAAPGPITAGVTRLDQNGISPSSPANGAITLHTRQRSGTEGELMRSASNVELRSWTNAESRASPNRARAGSSAEISRVLSDMDSFRPSQTQGPRPVLSRAPSSSSVDRRNAAPSSAGSPIERDRRNSTSTSGPGRDASWERPPSALSSAVLNPHSKPAASNSDARTISGILGDVRALPGGGDVRAPVGGMIASPSSRARDGASLIYERSDSGLYTQPQPHPQTQPQAQTQKEPPPQGQHSRAEGSMNESLAALRDRLVRPPPGPSNDRPPPQQRRGSFAEQNRGPSADLRGRSDSRGLGSVHVSTTGSPRRGSNAIDPRTGVAPAASAPRVPPLTHQSQRAHQSGRYENIQPNYRRDSFSDTRRDSYSDARRDYPPEPRRDLSRRDSMTGSRYDPSPAHQRRDSVLSDRERGSYIINERDRRDSMSGRERDMPMGDQRTLAPLPLPPNWAQRQPPQPQPPQQPISRPGGQLPTRAGPVEIQPEMLAPLGDASSTRSQPAPAVGKNGSPSAGGVSTPLRNNSPRGSYLRAESGSIRSSPMDMDSS